MSVRKNFVNGTVSALFAGGLATQFPNQLFLVSLAAGLGGCAFWAFQAIQKHLRSLWLPVVLTITVGSTSLIYYTVAYDEFATEQHLLVSVNGDQRVNLRTKPGKESEVVQRLRSGQEVTYVSRSWRRLHFSRENTHFFDYWRQVKIGNGTTGWLYGAYLTTKTEG